MSGQKWEFDCPQFVDFAAGFYEIFPVTDEWFGDLNGQKTPLPFKLRNEAFGQKIASPKLKFLKSLRNSPFMNFERSVKTDDEKLEMLGKLQCKEPTVVNGQRHRRSLSDSCVKTKNKLHPVIPICLKQTLNKNKKFKTTEELEMEKILEMQNDLFQYLRLNEINFKRLKENKAPYLRDKLFDKKFKQNLKILK